MEEAGVPPSIPGRVGVEVRADEGAEMTFPTASVFAAIAWVCCLA